MPLLFEKESYEIRGACFAIWKKFGGAFKETIVDKSLTIELKKRNLQVEDQKRINVYYEGKRVGAYVPDKIINDKILVEVKSKEFITKQDEKQFWDYLKASKYKLGFLINFGTNKLEIKRIVYDTARYMRKTK